MKISTHELQYKFALLNAHIVILIVDYTAMMTNSINVIVNRVLLD